MKSAIILIALVTAAFAQQQTISPSEMALHINGEIAQLASVAEQQDKIITQLKKELSEKKCDLPKDDK